MCDQAICRIPGFQNTRTKNQASLNAVEARKDDVMKNRKGGTHPKIKGYSSPKIYLQSLASVTAHNKRGEITAHTFVLDNGAGPHTYPLETKNACVPLTPPKPPKHKLRWGQKLASQNRYSLEDETETKYDSSRLPEHQYSFSKEDVSQCEPSPGTIPTIQCSKISPTIRRADRFGSEVVRSRTPPNNEESKIDQAVSLEQDKYSSNVTFSDDVKIFNPSLSAGICLESLRLPPSEPSEKKISNHLKTVFETMKPRYEYMELPSVFGENKDTSLCDENKEMCVAPSTGISQQNLDGVRKTHRNTSSIINRAPRMKVVSEPSRTSFLCHLPSTRNTLQRLAKKELSPQISVPSPLFTVELKVNGRPCEASYYPGQSLLSAANHFILEHNLQANPHRQAFIETVQTEIARKLEI